MKLFSLGSHAKKSDHNTQENELSDDEKLLLEYIDAPTLRVVPQQNPQPNPDNPFEGKYDRRSEPR